MVEENPDKEKSILKAFQAPGTTEQVVDSELITPRKLLRKIEKIEQFFQGPLPPPEILTAYEKIVPGCAKEIIDLFVKQANHRMKLEDRVVGGDSNRAYLGIACAFVICLVLIWLSYQLIIKGHPIAGALLGAFDIATLAGVFVYGTKIRRQERIQKQAITKKEIKPEE